MSSKEKEEDRFRIPDVSRIDLNRIARQPQTQPDYVPYNQKGRDPLDGATHKLGFFWLAGFGSGGAYGFVEGWKKAASPAFKIRMNSVLNSVSSRGTRIGNMLGVVAGFHTMFSGGIEYTTALSERTSTEWLTPALAGGLTGGLYKVKLFKKSFRGWAVAVAIGSVASVAYHEAGDIYANITRSMGGGQGKRR